MTGLTSTQPGDRAPAGTGSPALTDALDELERHRSTDVEARLQDARVREREALEAGWAVGAMRARLVVADMLHRVGRTSEAATLAVEVNGWAAANGPRPLLARSHLVLSSIFEGIGDLASGLDHAVRAIDLLGDAAPARERGNYLLRLADALSFNGGADRDQARRRYRQAEQIYVELGDTERRLVLLNNLAMLEYEADDVDAALEVVEEMRGLGVEDWLDPSAADTVGRVLLAAGDLEGAEAVLREGYRLLEIRGNVQTTTPAELALTLAEVLLAQGRIESAQDELDRCIGVCKERDLAGLRVQALRVRAEILAARGLYEDAYRAHRVFHREHLTLRSRQEDAAARTRQAIFETAEARRAAQRFWLQARTDPLTELYNRRFVDEELPRYLKEVAVHGGRLVVAIVDVDHFKRVNDTFTHVLGDHVLRRIAGLFMTTVAGLGGAEDAAPGFAARLGGEEFLLVQVVDHLRDGVRRVEDLRRAVEAEPWAELDPALAVTVSAGVTVAVGSDTQMTLLSRADANLYRAKASGRNLTVLDAEDAAGS